MQTVYVAENSVDAHLVRGLLESNGIEALVMGDYLQGAIGQLPAFGIIEVRVAERDAEAARSLVEEFQAGGSTDAFLEA